MDAFAKQPQYQESKIEDEPIPGPVLMLPDGRIQPLTWFERLLVRLHLTDARHLEMRYLKAAAS